MRRRSVMILAVIAVAIVASLIAFQRRTRAIPFDSNTWRSGDAKVRFRMKESLVAKQAAGELQTRDVVDRVLGPDDDRTDTPEYRYFHLENWDGNPWYLRIRFDEQGQVIDFAPRPD